MSKFKASLDSVFQNTFSLIAKKPLYFLLFWVFYFLIGFSEVLIISEVPKYFDSLEGGNLVLVIGGFILIIALIFFVFAYITAFYEKLYVGEKYQRDVKRKVTKSLSKLLLFSLLLILIAIPLVIFTIMFRDQFGPIYFNIFLVVLGLVILFLFIKFIFSQQAIILRGKGVFDSFRYSNEIVKGNWWRVFAYLLLILFSTGLILEILSQILNDRSLTNYINGYSAFDYNFAVIFYICMESIFSLFIVVYLTVMFLEFEKEKGLEVGDDSEELEPLSKNLIN